MSEGSDPDSVVEALDRAHDAFREVGPGPTTHEEGIVSGGGWKTKLTKACKLLEVATVLQQENGYYTAITEPSFGVIERSIGAYSVGMAGDDVDDFRDHGYSYERAHEVGLFEEETASAMMNLYGENRTESYYGGSRPTDDQATAMVDLASAVHGFATDQIREGGVCVREDT